ncbi:LacI family DNA-binding transcriptional regulator [Kitasatospora sp. KL5]|uniref:LacI family DNA-binding transcriptional regulator n=1 Tax=Kitasatospora sp. KL5 TaxID=3425125 RepID=UPI003D6DAC0E
MEHQMVTLAQVARHAGVSPSTVSYVISGKRSISQDTRLRVERSIAELGYHPHAGARALASNRSNVIALMIPLRTDMFVPVMMEIAIAITTTARRYGHDVLLLTSEEGPSAVKRIAASGLADAMILMDVELEDERIPLLRQTGAAAALIGLPADPAGLTCVDLDFEATGALAADHLADLGHREVALIGAAESVYRRHTGFAERTLAGFRQQAAARGLSHLHRPCGAGHEAASGTISRILQERPHTTGFVVQNEAALPHLLGQLRQSGRAVPEDVSVVAICPDEVALHSAPQLTSVSIPAQEMGRRAVELLMAQAGGEDTSGLTLLRPTLTVRESSGPAAATP